MTLFLGFTGTFASGKDTAISLIADRFRNKALQVSTSDLAREEVRKKGLPITRENIRLVANEMRLKHGAGFFGKKAVQIIKDNLRSYEVFLVSGTRSVGEIQALRQAFGKNFYLIAVDAPVEERYKRIKTRAREDEHVLSFEDFKKSEELEMKGAKHGQNIAQVMKLADFTIQNTGSVQELEEKIEEFLKKIMPNP
ncbi:AAA family ATPase [Candidatus Micrarchaeota archaeon]|nr:AAA family ATPase [Candidatus Micrarchaeota archaeon]